MIEEISDIEEQLEQMDKKYFLFGMLNAFMNRLQAAGDTFFEEVSWKQCFVMICINLFPKPPAIKELANVLGSSHQNVKQLLLKLQKLGYVELKTDEKDRRKQRVYVTDQGHLFYEKYDKPSSDFMNQLFQGIEEADISITIKTIMSMADNLSGFRNGRKEKE